MVSAILRRLPFLLFLLPHLGFASGIYNPGTPVTASTLPSGSTNYIQNTNSLQSGATFFVSSGTVNTLNTSKLLAEVPAAGTGLYAHAAGAVYDETLLSLKDHSGVAVLQVIAQGDVQFNRGGYGNSRFRADPNFCLSLSQNAMFGDKDWSYAWSNTVNWYDTLDTGLKRASAGIVQITDGGSGMGSIIASSITVGGTSTSPTAPFLMKKSGSQLLIDELSAGSIFAGITGASSMAAGTYAFLTTGTSTYLNAATTGEVGIRINNSSKLTVNSSGVTAKLDLLEVDSPSANIIGDELSAGNTYAGFTFGNGITGMNANAYSIIGNGTDTILNAPTGGTIIFRNNNNTKAVLDGTGKFSNYGAVTTAGWGVPAVYGSGRSTAQTGAVASVATYTVGSADGSFYVSTNLNVTAYTAGSLTAQCNYTDETNTARTLTFTVSNLTGTLGSAISATGPYEGLPVHIRAKASTAITILTTVTVFTGTYNVEGYVVQIG